MLKASRNWFIRSRLSPLSWLGVAGVVSCFAIVLTLGVMLFPSLPDTVQAVNTEEGGQHSGGGSADEDTATTSTSVSIGIPSAIAFDAVTPTASGATTTANANLTITTTNSASYSLYLYSSDGDNSLKSINPANTSTVDAITGDVGLTLSSLEPNTWGYSLGTSEPTTDTTYNAVPTSNDTPIQTKDTSSTASANDTYTLSFGAKVDTSIPSGTYTGTLTVAVVAEPWWIPVTYSANGGYFNNNPAQTTQMASYNIKTESAETKIAKTPNISEDGTDNGGGYGDEPVNIQSVTIPGASSLKVTVTYQLDATSALMIYDDSVTPSFENISSSISGMLTNIADLTTSEFIIPGDTVQFYFLSSSSSPSAYGYYATVQDPITTITPSSELGTPTRPGYAFLGWYKDAAGTEGNEFVIDGSLQATMVYAKWGINYLDDVTYMQDLTAVQCSGSYEGATATLIDKRDNSDYTIAKINGNCWMTQNLRLSGGRTLTPADSNVASDWSFPSTQLAGNSSSATEPQMTISSDTSYGGYYNYCAASAGTVCAETEIDATQDICPKGWRLPTNAELNTITSYASAFSPVLSGRYNSGSLIFIGSGGHWWSASAENIHLRYILDYNGSRLSTSIYGSRTEGKSVRCIRSS